MSSHMGRTYLNSCLKVPIDPCNNCPAPVFNRPKIYLGNLSATPNTSNTAGICSETGTESKWSCVAIRSLAKLYESIPDYRDLKHLKREDFYSTLNTLRSTCRALKVKTCCVNCEDRYNINTSFCSLKPFISNLEGNRNKTFEKRKKKKQCSANKNRSKFSEFQQRETVAGFSKKGNQENINETAEVNAKSFEKGIDEEIENFKKSLQELAAEFKRPLTPLNRKEYQPFTHSSSKDFQTKKQDVNKKLNEHPIHRLPVINTSTSTLHEGLRKSLSVNDLHSLTEPTELTELRKKNKTLELLSFKGQCNAEKDPTKLSNYFADMSKPETGGGPEMTIDSITASNGLQVNSKSKQNYNKTEECKMPFKFFDAVAGINNKITKNSTPSPIHPVARPNLAATLRTKSSKKKLEEHKNNCTFHDAPTQFDWEVRKTPAWKTLLLNESHKEILQLRLATRKAEQALQRREYELNMELMRQRVKSAPLLLEGPTYCGPHVGRLSHTCQTEDNRDHKSQSNQQRTRRRRNSTCIHKCRRSTVSSTSPKLEGSSVHTFRVQSDPSIDMSHKTKTLRKIYGTGSKVAKSESRNTNQSTSSHQLLKQHTKSNLDNLQENDKQSCKEELNARSVEIDSGDELSSLDRAFL